MLKAPEADGMAMEKELKAMGFSVTLLLNPARQEMLDATGAFGTKQTERKRVGLFYFSGHGSRKPNAFGLYDMHGNVSEWCLDSRDVKSELPGGIDPVALLVLSAYAAAAHGSLGT